MLCWGQVGEMVLFMHIPGIISLQFPSIMSTTGARAPLEPHRIQKWCFSTLHRMCWRAGRIQPVRAERPNNCALSSYRVRPLVRGVYCVDMFCWYCGWSPCFKYTLPVVSLTQLVNRTASWWLSPLLHHGSAQLNDS